MTVVVIILNDHTCRVNWSPPLWTEDCHKKFIQYWVSHWHTVTFIYSLTLRMWRCIRRFTPSSTAWAASPTPRPISGFGPSVWLMHVRHTSSNAHILKSNPLSNVLTRDAPQWNQYFFFLCLMHRAVRGAVVHGDAPWPFLQKPRRLHLSGPSLLLLCCSHSCHSSHYGRSVSLSTCTATALVSLILCVLDLIHTLLHTQHTPRHPQTMAWTFNCKHCKLLQ